MLDLNSKNKHSFWTVEEIAQLTGLSERTIWRYLESGKLESVWLGGRKIRHSQLVAFLGFDPLKEPALIQSIVESFARRKDSETHQATLPLFALTEDEK